MPKATKNISNVASLALAALPLFIVIAAINFGAVSVAGL